MTKPHSIQMTISISFTILSICSMTFLGVTLYRQFSNRAEAMTIESTGQLLNQTAINLEDYLRNMRRISDTMYYSVIKNKDLASDTMDEEIDTACAESVWRSILPLLLGRILKPCRGADK